MRDNQQQDARRLFRRAPPLFPIADGGQAEAETFGESLLAEPKAGADGANIDTVRHMKDKSGVALAPREGPRRANAGENAATGPGHDSLYQLT